jgi:hypothetical protein
MCYAFHNAMFHSMGERAMAYIVQQDGSQQPISLRIRYVNLLITKHLNGLLHKVHASQRMMKTGMMRSRVYQVRKPHLGYSSQSLKVRMRYKFKNGCAWNPNKSVNWIIE